jgi:hypothetical protein
MPSVGNLSDTQLALLRARRRACPTRRLPGAFRGAGGRPDACNHPYISKYVGVSAFTVSSLTV